VVSTVSEASVVLSFVSLAVVDSVLAVVSATVELEAKVSMLVVF